MNYFHKLIIILTLLSQLLTATDTIENKLTNEEIEFIKKHPLISFRVRPNMPPFEFVQNGIASGIAVDYIKKSAENIGLNIDFVVNNDPLGVAHNTIENQNGKYNTILFAVKNKQRAERFSFGMKYLSYPMMIITHKNSPKITSLNDVKNKTIVLEESFLTNKWIKRDYPSIKIVNAPNTKEALQMVNDENVIAYVGNLGVATYMRIFNDMDNIKVSAHSGYGDINYSFIAPKEWPELSSLLSKGFEQISTVEHSFIQQKWFSIQTIEKTDYSLLWKIVLVLSGVILLVLLWNRKITIEKNKTNQVLLELERSKDKEAKSKNELLKSNEKFNRYFQLSLNLHLISTTEGIIKEVNSAFKSILGYEQDKLLGKQFLDLLHPDDLEPTIEEMSKLSRGKNVYNFENRYIHKDGHYVNLLWTATTDSSNNLIYATAQDLTSLKKIELEQKEKDKLLKKSEKLASMGDMIVNIAHQWRQPLSVISTASTGMLLQKEYNTLSDADFIINCNSINTNVQYLSKTIDDFRNFIKNDNITKVFNLTDSITSFLHLVEGTAKNNDISIILDLEDAINIDGFENHLAQCLINIFSNAKDALVEKNIDTKLIFIDTKFDINKVIIRIKDNAGGIPINILPKIFEPYFTTKHESQGTGLGLHMTYNLIVEGMGGTIETYNTTYKYDGKDYSGAEFTISLPLS